MNSTERPFACSRKTSPRRLPPFPAAVPSPDSPSNSGSLEKKGVSQATSPAIAQATRNAGMVLYEILGLAELIRVAYEKGELTSVEARLSHLVSEAARLTSSISNIVSLARIEAGQTAPVSEHFDIVAMLLDVSDRAREIIANRPVMVMDVFPTDPVIIRSDPDALLRIMTELVSNAAKFTDRGRIAVILARTNDMIRLTVADTGQGMTRSQIKAVFETSDHSYDIEVNGLESPGLGLRIVRSLVKQLKAGLSVSSKPGEGTIVEVSLPLNEADGKRADARTDR